MQETWEMEIQSLVPEDPLEKEMTTCSNSLALEIPWTEESGGLQSLGLQSQQPLNQITSCHITTVRWVLVFSHVQMKENEGSHFAQDQTANNWSSSIQYWVI